MLQPNFRQNARKHIDAAKEQLSAQDDGRLKYAALELRMAMEAVTYARALSYKDEIAPETYETWQPKKLMLFLLEVDPDADQSYTLSIGLETEYGVEPKEMAILGTDRVLSLLEIKKNYDALGHYLHVPTYKQFLENGQNLVSLRERCVALIDMLDKIVSSPINNCHFYILSSVNCARCDHLMKKNVAHLKESDVLNAKCLGCGAGYKIRKEGEVIRWTPQKSLFNCTKSECNKEISVWNDDLAVGQIFPCSNCGSKNTAVLSITLTE